MVLSEFLKVNSKGQLIATGTRTAKDYSDYISISVLGIKKSKEKTGASVMKFHGVLVSKNISN